jgi:ribbon-helix-helix CopG family protein
MSGQMAFWNHESIYDSIKPLQRKKHSEKRRRNDRVTIRLLPSELEALDAAAEFLGIGRSELIRWSALDYVRFFPTHLKAIRSESTKEEQS